MDHQDSNTLAEPVAAADVAHVKVRVWMIDSIYYLRDKHYLPMTR